jgi:hypothetical protein
MHPRLLKTFLAVARSRTITGAAEASSGLESTDRSKALFPNNS